MEELPVRSIINPRHCIICFSPLLAVGNAFAARHRQDRPHRVDDGATGFDR